MLQGVCNIFQPAIVRPVTGTGTGTGTGTSTRDSVSNTVTPGIDKPRSFLTSADGLSKLRHFNYSLIYI